MLGRVKWLAIILGFGNNKVLQSTVKLRAQNIAKMKKK